MNYADTHANHVNDHRVNKAVLLNSANTSVLHADGSAWTQATHGTPGDHNNPLTVDLSLDPELGAGALNVQAALWQFAPAEVHAGHSNNLPKLVVPESQTAISTTEASRFWDLETVAANGRVDYLLPEMVPGDRFRSTLTWDSPDGIAANLPNLELRLYHEGNSFINNPGFELADGDLLLAQTDFNGENVKLMDFLLGDWQSFVTDPALPFENGYYLEVINNSATATEYGLAVLMPEPGILSAGVAAALLLSSRRRRAACVAG